MLINGQRFWLVHKFKAGIEGQNNDAAALSMGVSSAKLHPDQHPWLLLRCQQCANLLPVCTEVSEEFKSEGHSLIEDSNQQTGQYGIEFQKRQHLAWFAEVLYKGVKTLLRCFPLQTFLEAGNIQFKRHGLDHSRQ